MSRIRAYPSPVRRARYKSGLYYGAVGVTSTATTANNSLRLAPFFVDRPTVFDRIGIEITSAGEAGAKFRPVVMSDTGDGYPDGLVLDAGQLAADAIANVEATISLALQPGLYWLGGAVQSAPTTQPTMRTLATTFIPAGIGMTGIATLAAGYSQGSVSGAAPANFTATPANSTPPRVTMRAA